MVAEDGAGIVRRLGGVLRALVAVVERGVEHGFEVRAAAQHGVPQGDRADHLARAAGTGGAAAQQAHHVAGIGVEVEAGVGVVAPAVLALVGGAHVAHIVHEVAGAVLRAGHAHVQAHAPVGEAGLALGPAVHGKAFDQAHAPAALRGVDGAGQRVTRGGIEREVIGGHLQQRLVQRAGVVQGGVEAGDLGGGEALDPGGVAVGIGGQPRGGAIGGVIWVISRVIGSHGGGVSESYGRDVGCGRRRSALHDVVQPV
ncbi:hypothetical protein D3C81_1124570 [compost metagenome]